MHKLLLGFAVIGQFSSTLLAVNRGQCKVLSISKLLAHELILDCECSRRCFLSSWYEAERSFSGWLAFKAVLNSSFSSRLAFTALLKSLI